MRLDPDGVVTFRTRQLRPGRVPSVPRGRWCAPARPSSPGRHPSPHSDRPLSPAGTSHRAGVVHDEASTRVHAIHPSGLPQPVATGWNGGPWALPRASHPAVTRDARRGGDGPCALDRTLRLRHQPNLLRRESLPACDFRVAPLLEPRSSRPRGRNRCCETGHADGGRIRIRDRCE